MANEQKRYTTFLSMVNANKKNGTFVSTTVGGLISRFSYRDVNGKKLIRALMPIQNRAKAINRMLGTNFPEDTEDAIWVDVAFWEARADRFEHMLEKLGNPDKIRVVLVGSLSARTYTKKDGGEGIALTLAVSDWMLIGIPENAQKGIAIEGKSNSTAANNTGATGKNPFPAATSAANTDFDDDGFFNDFDISIDDLPF